MRKARDTFTDIHRSISNTQEQGPVKNQIAKALVERIVRAGREGKKFRVRSPLDAWPVEHSV